MTATNSTNETAREFYKKEIAVMEKGLVTDRAKKRKMSARSNAQLSARSNSNIAVRAKSNVFGNLSGFNTQKNSNQPTQLDRQMNYFLSKNLRGPPQVAKYDLESGGKSKRMRQPRQPNRSHKIRSNSVELNHMRASRTNTDGDATDLGDSSNLGTR